MAWWESVLCSAAAVWLQADRLPFHFGMPGPTLHGTEDLAFKNHGPTALLGWTDELGAW